MRFCKTAFAIALSLAAVSRPARGQASSARVDGIVADAKGLPLPNVEVTLTAANTGLVRVTRSSSSGTYSFPSLDPGPYTIHTAAPGFATEVRRIQLEVNQALRLDWTLTVQAASEHV